jgi:hypothetical protein
MTNTMTAGFGQLMRRVIPAAERGMGFAGVRLMRDTIMDMPTVPLEEGTLRGSGTVHVQGVHKETAPNVGGNPTPNTTEIPKPVGADLIDATVGFNTPYAAYQHEGVRRDGTHIVKNYTQAGSGAKYLEKKLIGNRSIYLGLAANEIRKELGG